MPCGSTRKADRQMTIESSTWALRRSIYDRPPEIGERLCQDIGRAISSSVRTIDPGTAADFYNRIAVFQPERSHSLLAIPGFAETDQ